LLCFASLLNPLNTKESLSCGSVQQPWNFKLLKFWNSSNPRSIRRRILELKWELCKGIWKGVYLKKIWCSVGIPSSIRRTLKSLKWELCRIIWKGGYLKKIWGSFGSPSSIRRNILKI
jgi:hypothetical protein